MFFEFCLQDFNWPAEALRPPEAFYIWGRASSYKLHSDNMP